MAKKQETQLDMFPVIPEVVGLGITKFEIGGASVKATVEGVTNTNDIALLDNPCWQKAVAEWLLSLHGGDVELSLVSVKKAYVDLINKTDEAHRPTVEDVNTVTDEALPTPKNKGNGSHAHLVAN